MLCHIRQDASWRRAWAHAIGGGGPINTYHIWPLNTSESHSNTTSTKKKQTVSSTLWEQQQLRCCPFVYTGGFIIVPPVHVYRKKHLEWRRGASIVLVYTFLNSMWLDRYKKESATLEVIHLMWVLEKVEAFHCLQMNIHFWTPGRNVDFRLQHLL